MDFSLGNKRQRFTQLYRSRSTQKRIFWFRINRYRKKLLISFRLLSMIYKICKNHKKWSKTAARRAVLIFQTGFSQPVDPEFWIFLAKDNLRKKICPQSPCLPSQVAHSLQNVICKILKFPEILFYEYVQTRDLPGVALVITFLQHFSQFREKSNFLLELPFDKIYCII